MKSRRAKRKVKVMAAVLALIGPVVFLLVANAGDLEPTDPPGPTMKTLDQVEPRIPIPASATPTAPFVINSSGSYYLAGDRRASGNGIEVYVDNVTIDLMGYTLSGLGIDSGTGYGIYIDGQRNVEIRNGTVWIFGQGGIYEVNDIYGRRHRIINVRAEYNRHFGIRLLGEGHLVKDCTAGGNKGLGIRVMGGSTVAGNTVYDNTNGSGIETSVGCTVTGNTVFGNHGKGIYAYPGSTVTNNTVYENVLSGINAGQNCTVIGNTSYGNQKNGIYTLGGSTVMNNTVANNRESGISAGVACTVIGNNARYNNLSNTDGQGGLNVHSCIVKENMCYGNNKNNIYVFGSNSAVEENLVIASANGICFNSTGNFYANNRASDNTTNYAGNVPTGSGDGGGNAEF